MKLKSMEVDLMTSCNANGFRKIATGHVIALLAGFGFITFSILSEASEAQAKSLVISAKDILRKRPANFYRMGFDGEPKVCPLLLASLNKPSKLIVGPAHIDASTTLLSNEYDLKWSAIRYRGLRRSERIQTAQAVATDIDNDGKEEIVVRTKGSHRGGLFEYHIAYVVKGDVARRIIGDNSFIPEFSQIFRPPRKKPTYRENRLVVNSENTANISISGQKFITKNMFIHVININRLRYLLLTSAHYGNDQVFYHGKRKQFISVFLVNFTSPTRMEVSCQFRSRYEIKNLKER